MEKRFLLRFLQELESHGRSKCQTKRIDSIICGEQWLNRISPATYIIYGLAVDQMGENTDVLITPEGQTTTVSAFLASYFGYEYSFRWCVHLTFSCLQQCFPRCPRVMKLI